MAGRDPPVKRSEMGATVGVTSSEGEDLRESTAGQAGSGAIPVNPSIMI